MTLTFAASSQSSSMAASPRPRVRCPPARRRSRRRSRPNRNMASSCSIGAGGASNCRRSASNSADRAPHLQRRDRCRRAAARQRRVAARLAEDRRGRPVPCDRNDRGVSRAASTCTCRSHSAIRKPCCAISTSTCDVGVVARAFEDTRYFTQRYASFPVIAFVRTTRPFAKRDAITLHELAGEPLLMREPEPTAPRARRRAGGCRRGASRWTSAAARRCARRSRANRRRHGVEGRIRAGCTAAAVAHRRRSGRDPYPRVLPERAAREPAGRVVFRRGRAVPAARCMTAVGCVPDHGAVDRNFGRSIADDRDFRMSASSRLPNLLLNPIRSRCEHECRCRYSRLHDSSC